MQSEEIKEILRRKDGGKIDSYILKNNKKKATQMCLMNVLQTWTHSLLYYKQIYSPEAFAERQLLGVTVFAASSPPLKEYLDDFFAALKPHLPKINHFQIVLVSTDNSILQLNTLYIEDFEEPKLEDNDNIGCAAMGSIQNEIQFKSFLYDLKNNFVRGFVRQKQEVSFRFRVGYRLEQGNDPVSASITQEWVKREKIQSSKIQIMGSLKWNSLNVIHEVMRCQVVE